MIIVCCGKHVAMLCFFSFYVRTLFCVIFLQFQLQLVVEDDVFDVFLLVVEDDIILTKTNLIGRDEKVTTLSTESIMFFKSVKR